MEKRYGHEKACRILRLYDLKKCMYDKVIYRCPIRYIPEKQKVAEKLLAVPLCLLKPKLITLEALVLGLIFFFNLLIPVFAYEYSYGPPYRYQDSGAEKVQAGLHSHPLQGQKTVIIPTYTS